MFVVADSFETKDLGLILTPGIPEMCSHLCPGSPILLKRPNGSVLETRIAGINVPRPRKPGASYPISLPVEIRKEDVPVGTEVHGL